MSILAAAAMTVGSSIFSGLMGDRSAKRTANAQVDAAKRAAAAQLEAQRIATEEAQRQFDLSRQDLLEQYEQQREDNAPLLAFRQAGAQLGERALAPLEQQIMDPFEADLDVDLEEDPGYRYRFSEGQRALERSAARHGGLLSGRNLKALQTHGQQLGSQEYGQAYGRAVDRYNRLSKQKSDYISNLGALAGYGNQTASTNPLGSQLSSLEQSRGTMLANAALQSGAARAQSAFQQGQATAGAYAADPWGRALTQGASDLATLYGSQQSSPSQLSLGGFGGFGNVQKDISNSKAFSP